MTEYTLRERWLGTALQALRERARMTQKEAAAHLRYKNQKLSRIESGQPPDIDALRAMLDLYGVLGHEEAPYLEMYERAAEKGSWRAQSDSRSGGYVSLEHDATTIWNYETKLLPGLLQLESYVRSVFAGRISPRSQKWVDDQTAMRVRRRQRLFGDPPLVFNSVIDELAFKFVDREQLLYVNEIGERSNVTVQVLLDSPEFHEGFSGSFSLLEFPYPEVPKILFVEYVTDGASVVEEPSAVATASKAFDHLAELALSPEDSAEWIRRPAAERF